MNDVPSLSVLACFGDRIAAEIACALLADASIRCDEPTAAVDGGWRIELRGLAPVLSARAEVILRRAGAMGTEVMVEERQSAA